MREADTGLSYSAILDSIVFSSLKVAAFPSVPYIDRPRRSKPFRVTWLQARIRYFAAQKARQRLANGVIDEQSQSMTIRGSNDPASVRSTDVPLLGDSSTQRRA